MSSWDRLLFLEENSDGFSKRCQVSSFYVIFIFFKCCCVPVKKIRALSLSTVKGVILVLSILTSLFQHSPPLRSSRGNSVPCTTGGDAAWMNRIPLTTSLKIIRNAGKSRRFRKEWMEYCRKKSAFCIRRIQRKIKTGAQTRATKMGAHRRNPKITSPSKRIVVLFSRSRRDPVRWLTDHWQAENGERPFCDACTNFKPAKVADLSS